MNRFTRTDEQRLGLLKSILWNLRELAETRKSDLPSVSLVLKNTKFRDAVMASIKTLERRQERWQKQLDAVSNKALKNLRQHARDAVVGGRV